MQARGFPFNISLSFNCYKYTTFFWNKQESTNLFSIIYNIFLDPPDLQISRSPDLRIFAIKKTNNSKNMAALGRDREITEREKAIITAAIFNGKDQTQEDWDKIFLLSRNGATKIQTSSRGSAQSVSWKSRNAVKKFHQAESERIDNIFRERENKAITDLFRNKSKDEISDIWEKIHESDCNNGNGGRTLLLGAAQEGNDHEGDDNLQILTGLEVDFRDREQFLNFLNAEANRIKDGKTRLDVLKMLSDLQRMKEAENGKNGEIQRFYTPLQCRDCELYCKAKAEIESD